MAKPLDVASGEFGTVVILVITFLGHHMREYVLGLVAPDEQALDDVAFGPCLVDSSVVGLALA